LRGSARVVVLSRAMVDPVRTLGVAEERIVVQYNGVDLESFREREVASTRRALGLPLDRSIVLFVGNLVPVKGPDVLLDAFARLVSAMQEPPLLVVAGGGRLRPALEQTVGSARLSEHVRFVGARPHSEIPQWISASDVLCLPSRMEGCPNVILEAFASGRPVVASSVGGVPELVLDDRGVLVPPGDPEALARGLTAALARRGWDAATIRQSVAHLTWDAFGRTFERVAREAVDETRVGGEARPPEDQPNPRIRVKK